MWRRGMPRAMEGRFADRRDAGRRLADRLSHLRDGPDVVVLALPRGGVPVGYEVARALRAPLDVFVVRKLGVPGHEELAMGAIASGDVRFLNRDVLDQLRIDRDTLERVTAAESEELRRRERAYRGDAPALDARGRTVVLVDDGLATGSSMIAAIASLREHAPERIVVGVPVGAASVCRRLPADEVVCVLTPSPMNAISIWYDDFDQTTDTEVRALLEEGRGPA